MRPAGSKSRTTPRPIIALPAAKVHAWRLGRQMLLPGSAATDPEDVAKRLVGVQAQVVSSAAIAIALRSMPARGEAPAVDATMTALRDRRLVRAWAMRGTLHLFAAEDVPTIAAALGGKDNWRRPAWLRWFGLSEPEMDELIDAIGGILDDGRPRTRAELAAEIGTRLGARQARILLGSWGSALKVASDRHYLVQSADEDAGVRFVRASRWIDGWQAVDPGEALTRLVPRYLAAYGPATATEIRRWWGVARVAVLKPVIETLGPALAEVEVDGTRAYVRAEDVDEIAATQPLRGAVQFVGGFDPFIVGAGLREQLIPPAHLKRVSRTAGWISPVVLVDGRAAAVWDASVSGKVLAITVETFSEPPGAVRARIAKAAERVGLARGLAVRVAYGRVFQGKQSAVRFNVR